MTDQPLTRVDSVLFIENNTYTLVDEAHPQDRFPDPLTTGVIAVADDGKTGAAAITCGTHIGDVRLAIETWDSVPPLAAALWEDVAEASLRWAGGRMVVWGADDDEEEGAEVSVYDHAPAGSYRIRIHVRGRDDGEDRNDIDPPEEHLLQIWPAPPGPEAALKSTDATGGLWRSR
jgi:hypothetical protein